MRILWELRHPNILTFFGVAFVRKANEELMCMVTELCAGSLDMYIGTAEKKQEALERGMPELTDALLLKMLKDSAAGIAFMHERRLIHRDLKVRSCCLYGVLVQCTARPPRPQVEQSLCGCLSMRMFEYADV
jgi:serine/threonine protein kinase